MKKESRKQVTWKSACLGLWPQKTILSPSSLSLLTFCFLKPFLLLLTKIWQQQKIWCMLSNVSLGKWPGRLGSAQGQIPCLVCQRPPQSQHETPAANKPMLLPGQGSLLASAGSSVAWLRTHSCDLQPAPALAWGARLEKSIGVVTLDQSMVHQVSTRKHLLTDASKEPHWAVACPWGGFPVTGSCGPACTLQCRSPTSSLRQKNHPRSSPRLARAAQYLWTHGFVPELRALPSFQQQKFPPSR